MNRSVLLETGAIVAQGAARDVLPELLSIWRGLPQEQAGVRLVGNAALTRLLSDQGAIGRVAQEAMDRDCRPVRTILFDKTVGANWSLGWHQDRRICVRQRMDVGGYGPWTVKQGLIHVAPPFDLLANMLTLRVHLDDVSSDNAPLLIAPGSHRRGRIAEADLERVVEECGVFECLAEAGDIWIYSTPILHASKPALVPGRRRRVLQVDYSADALPGALEWLGI